MYLISKYVIEKQNVSHKAKLPLTTNSNFNLPDSIPSYNKEKILHQNSLFPSRLCVCPLVKKIYSLGGDLNMVSNSENPEDELKPNIMPKPNDKQRTDHLGRNPLVIV